MARTHFVLFSFYSKCYDCWVCTKIFTFSVNLLTNMTFTSILILFFFFYPKVGNTIFSTSSGSGNMCLLYSPSFGIGRDDRDKAGFFFVIVLICNFC